MAGRPTRAPSQCACGAARADRGHPYAGGRLAAEVRLDAADRDRASPALAQPSVEIDITVKRRVHGLDDAQVGLAGDDLLQLEARRPALKRTAPPVVLDKHDRITAPAPRGDQLGDVRLGVGVVAGPELRIVESTLYINHKQGTLASHSPTLRGRIRCLNGMGRHTCPPG